MFPDEYRTSTSVRATWSIASNTGGVALTGFGLLRWPTGTAEPPHSQAIVVGEWDGHRRDHDRADAGHDVCVQDARLQRSESLLGLDRRSHLHNARRHGHARAGDESAAQQQRRQQRDPGVERARQQCRGGGDELSRAEPAAGADWPGGFDVAQGAGTTTFSVSQLVDGTIYEFQVRACNAAGCGAWTELAPPGPRHRGGPQGRQRQPDPGVGRPGGGGAAGRRDPRHPEGQGGLRADVRGDPAGGTAARRPAARGRWRGRPRRRRGRATTTP